MMSRSQRGGERMNNKQQTAVDIAELAMKLYPFSNSERNAFINGYNKAKEMEKEQRSIELPSDEEIEEKLNVAYGNGYEQGEMDFYKKMQVEGNQYADGYAEGYQRALELVKFQIVEQLEARR